MLSNYRWHHRPVLYCFKPAGGVENRLSEGGWAQDYHPLDPHLMMYSELAVPLLSSDGTVAMGVLNVESPEPNTFTLQHKFFMEALALRAQMAIQRAQLSEAIRIIGQKVLAMDQDGLLAYVVEALSDLMQVLVCSIWLIDNSTGELVLKQAIGRPKPTAETPDIRLSQDSFIGQVINTRRPVSSLNVQQEPNFVHLELAKEQDWISALVVPSSLESVA